MLALTIERLIYILEKPYPMLPEKQIEKQVKELENYMIDDLIDRTIILAYMEDDLNRFFKDYKATNHEGNI